MSTIRRIALCSVLACLVGAGGCGSYHQVRDPQSGKVYYTSEMKKRGSGAVSLKDGATGGQVTVQNSEVREISKDQYEANRRLSGQDPQAEAKAKAKAAEEQQAAARAAEQRAAEERAAAKQADATAAEAKAKAAEGDVALTAAAVGAAAAKHAESAQQLRVDLVASKDQVDRSLASLTDLTDPNQTDLAAAYKRFNDQLTRMNQQSQKVKVEADQMRQARDAYFAKWDARLAATDNPTIRAEAESKRARLRAGQEKIAADAARAREAYQPFIIDLEDTRKFVGTDVSKESVSVLGPTVKKAQQDGAVLKERLDVLIADLDAIEGKPPAKPSSPAAAAPGSSAKPASPPPPPAAQ